MVDEYERATQLGPAAAVLAPISVLAVVIIRADDLTSIVRSIVGVLAAAGFHLVAMRLVRDRGNIVQQRLWNSWGGNPAVQRLHWSSRTDATTVERLHRRVQATTKVQLPTRSEEEADLGAAQEAYTDAVARLREMTRDHGRYPRVWSELKQYGTARNLYGAKPAGLVVAAAVLAASLIMVGASLTHHWSVRWWWPAIAGAVALAIGVVWFAFITPVFVQTAAERYSDALLAVPEEPNTPSK